MHLFTKDKIKNKTEKKMKAIMISKFLDCFLGSVKLDEKKQLNINWKVDSELTVVFTMLRLYQSQNKEYSKRIAGEFKELMGDPYCTVTTYLPNHTIMVELAENGSTGQAWIKVIDQNLKDGGRPLSGAKINEYFGPDCCVTITTNEDESVWMQHVEIMDTSYYKSHFSTSNFESSDQEG